MKLILNDKHLKDLITITETDGEVEFKVGTYLIARALEDDGVWYPYVMGHQIGLLGFDSKDKAYSYILNHLAA